MVPQGQTSEIFGGLNSIFLSSSSQKLGNDTGGGGGTTSISGCVYNCLGIARYTVMVGLPYRIESYPLGLTIEVRTIPLGDFMLAVFSVSG